MIATGAAGLVERAIDDREAAAADLAIDPVVQQLVAAGEGLVGDGHGQFEVAGVFGRTSPAIRVPGMPVCLARRRRTHTLSLMHAFK